MSLYHSLKGFPVSSAKSAEEALNKMTQLCGLMKKTKVVQHHETGPDGFEKFVPELTRYENEKFALEVYFSYEPARRSGNYSGEVINKITGEKLKIPKGRQWRDKPENFAYDLDSALYNLREKSTVDKQKDKNQSYDDDLPF